MINSKLISQYTLEPIALDDKEKSEIFLGVNIYQNLANEFLNATVERLDLCEIKPFSSKEFAHVDIWVKDDFCSMLIERIHDKDEFNLIHSFIESLRNHGFIVSS
jgi:hypothetical protein